MSNKSALLFISVFICDDFVFFHFHIGSPKVPLTSVSHPFLPAAALLIFAPYDRQVVFESCKRKICEAASTTLKMIQCSNQFCQLPLGINDLVNVFISCEAFAEDEIETQTESKSSEETGSDKPKDDSSEVDDQTVAKKLMDDVNKTSNSNTNKTVLLSCILNKPNISSTVEIVNATRLSQVLQLEHNVTHRGIPGTCVAVLFYSPSCPFSCMAAPHFNALPRFFPDIKMVAVDAMQYRGFNTQYGIVGTPTLMLFHSGRPAFKFNETFDYKLEIFSNFITKHTGIKPTGKLVVTSADFGGPVSSVPVKETDYYLTLSWMVIAARILYSLYYSTWGRSLVDATLNAWREAEAQHHHAE